MPEVECPVCEVVLVSLERYVDHKTGNFHMRKLNVRNAPLEPVVLTNLTGTVEGLLCQICEKNVTGWGPFVEHLQSERHQARVQEHKDDLLLKEKVAALLMSKCKESTSGQDRRSHAQPAWNDRRNRGGSSRESQGSYRESQGSYRESQGSYRESQGSYRERPGSSWESRRRESFERRRSPQRRTAQRYAPEKRRRQSTAGDLYRRDERSKAASTEREKKHPEVNCFTCNRKLPNKFDYLTHLEGYTHKKNADKLDDFTIKMKLVVCNTMEDWERYEADSECGVVPGMSGLDAFCSVCISQLTSHSRAELHFSGSRHTQKVHRLTERDRKGESVSLVKQVDPKYCTVCDLPFEKVEEITQHFDETEHIKRATIALKMGKEIPQFFIKDRFSEDYKYVNPIKEAERKKKAAAEEQRKKKAEVEAERKKRAAEEAERKKKAVEEAEGKKKTAAAKAKLQSADTGGTSTWFDNKASNVEMTRVLSVSSALARLGELPVGGGDAEVIDLTCEGDTVDPPVNEAEVSTKTESLGNDSGAVAPGGAGEDSVSVKQDGFPSLLDDQMESKSDAVPQDGKAAMSETMSKSEAAKGKEDTAVAETAKTDDTVGDTSDEGKDKKASAQAGRHEEKQTADISLISKITINSNPEPDISMIDIAPKGERTETEEEEQQMSFTLASTLSSMAQQTEQVKEVSEAHPSDQKKSHEAKALTIKKYLVKAAQGSFFCEICKVYTHSQGQMDVHKKGNQHKTVLAKADEAQANKVQTSSQASTTDSKGDSPANAIPPDQNNLPLFGVNGSSISASIPLPEGPAPTDPAAASLADVPMELDTPKEGEVSAGISLGYLNVPNLMGINLSAPPSHYGPPTMDFTNGPPPMGFPGGPPMGPPNGPPMGFPDGSMGPPNGPQMGFPDGSMGPPMGFPDGSMGPPNGPPMGFPDGPPMGPPNGPPMGFPDSSMGPPMSFPDGPPMGPPMSFPDGPPMGPPMGFPDGPPIGPPNGPPMGFPDGPPMGFPDGPPMGPNGPPFGHPNGPPMGPAMDCPADGHPSLMGLQPDQRSLSQSQSSSRHREKWICSICNITATCKFNLDDHLRGPKHKAMVKSLEKQGSKRKLPEEETKESEEAEKIPAAENSTEETTGTLGGLGPFYCSVCNVSPDSEASMKDHLAGTEHKASVDTYGARYCLICNMRFNSVHQMNNHLSGNKHKASMGLLDEEPRKKWLKEGPYYCSSCNLAFSSKPELAQHMKGKCKAHMETLKPLENPGQCWQQQGPPFPNGPPPPGFQGPPPQYSGPPPFGQPPNMGGPMGFGPPGPMPPNFDFDGPCGPMGGPPAPNFGGPGGPGPGWMGPPPGSW